MDKTTEGVAREVPPRNNPPLSNQQQRASKSREETAIATVGKLISILHLVAGPRTRNVM